MYLKARSPIYFTALPSFIVFRLLHSEKAQLSIPVVAFPIVTLTIFSDFSNAYGGTAALALKLTFFN